MRLSTDEILTTHTGSLPRPPALVEALEARDRGDAEQTGFADQVRDAVKDVVQRQSRAGVTVVNDGEASKIGYTTYVKERLDGFGGKGETFGVPADLLDFPDFLKRGMGDIDAQMSACVGPISYRDVDAVRADITNLKAAVEGVDVKEAFMTAASPGVISVFLSNAHYGSHEEYIAALADAMKAEYDEIHRAGLVLQIDCPDLAMTRQLDIDESLDDFRRRSRLHVEALNYATRDIPPEGMRMHLCWGNYEGPHHYDVPLGDIIDIVFEARPAAISFEGANPRHEHEYQLFDDIKLPEGKALIPGVLDTTTNYIEHPQLVAQRLVRYAKRVGRENVLAGSDCGFGTFASDHPTIDPEITWAKLGAMVEGAKLASRQLW